MDVGIVGGTGDEGFGLALRLGRAGHRIVIGSRSAERGMDAAERARSTLGLSAKVAGTSNDKAAEVCELLFVTVPYAGQADTYRALKPHVGAEQVVVDATSPLATAVGGRAWQVLRPWHGSAAEQAKALLGDRGRLVSGFHTVSAELLQDLDRTMEGDVLLCGDDDEAKAAAGSLVEDIPDLRWVDAGSLQTARIVEPLTALMVSVNRKYKLHDTGIALTGRTSWGRPGG